MRLHSIFIPVLISAGVISSGIADQNLLSGQELMCQALIESGRNPEDFGIRCNSNPGNVETFLREKCEKNGSPLSYRNAKESLDFFGGCSGLVVDVKQIARDIQATEGLRELLRNVYKKYCLRVPVLKECVKYTTNSISSCLEESEERESAEILYNITSSFLEFVCYEDGVRFAMFEDPGTARCVASKGDAMLSCVEETFGSYLPSNTSADVGVSQALGRLAKPLIPSTEDCVRLESLQNCTVELLAECDSFHGSPANLLNSMFNSIKTETPCERLIELGGWEPTDYLQLPDNNETEIFNTTMSAEYAEAENITFTNSLKERCDENGGPGAYDIAKKAPQILESCLESVINTTELQTQLKSVAPFSNLDFLFAKHCRKVPKLKKCVKRAVKSIKPCLDPEAQDSIEVLNNVTRALLRFGCQDNGARIGNFVSTGGLDCMELQKEPLQLCAREIFRRYPSAVTAGYDGFARFEATLDIATDDCDSVQEFQRCIVSALEGCGEQTNAKVVGSLIKSLIKATPCRGSPRRRSKY